ncbi:MAG: DUF6512 family protein [Oscillospiraceae bacterium]|nr:DUF6512 family protein [Oscillospiraceae bacterium]
MSKKHFFLSEVFGVIFIATLGIFLKCLPNELTNSEVMQLIVPIRISVWEEIKVFIGPYCFWCMLQLLAIRPPKRKFIATKVFSLYFFICFILVSFEISNNLNKEMCFLPDFSLIFLSLLLSQLISYRIIVSRLFLDPFFFISCICLVLFCCLCVLFTFFPPRLEVFYDFS